MTVAGLMNLAAWLLSAVIAAWLLYDMTRVSRQHDERQLIGLPDPLDDVDGTPRPTAGTQRAGTQRAGTERAGTEWKEPTG